MTTGVGSVLLASVLALAATGCSGPEVIGEPYDGAGPGVLATHSADTGPAAGWVTVGERFFVTTYGSSSCPTAPTAVETGVRGPIVTMSRTGGNACTADLGPASYALDLPGRFRGEGPVVVSLRFDDTPDVDVELPLSASP
ncbi:hypothetical protein DEJ28_09690 [Curtobacterium sp. MCPF17_002]|uniref:hypothetical protein n=1 Tax=Curtobacterium sp. MCPF17_002 TaxID=2175645 RepID=UPI000DA765AB|nr:hypothetical protein [Curtobacterium sp. MCPF17_002]WIB75965.1 hypothetical protein DEJ28_09690 [Curtobacterium sp. MCPF17_002]